MKSFKEQLGAMMLVLVLALSVGACTQHHAGKIDESQDLDSD